MKHYFQRPVHRNLTLVAHGPHALQGILANSSHNLAHRSGGRNNIPVCLLLRDTGDNLLDIFLVYHRNLFYDR